MRSVRLGLALAVMGTLIVAGPAPSAGAAACPQTQATYRYDETSMDFLFTIRLCEPMNAIPFSSEGTREDLLGHGLTIFLDGFAPCEDRVCRTRVGFVHELEVARYEANVFWGTVAFDELGWIHCRTTSSASGCRPGP